MHSTALYESHIKSLPLISRGKVRDIYAVDDEHLLMITTDRLSAFDVVMGQAIPHKGAILQHMSLFWFDYFADDIANHLSNKKAEHVVQLDEVAQVQHRGLVVKKLQPILIEAVVRGYVAGSAWQEYQQTQQVCGMALPPGLLQSQALSEPIFTPAAKANVGAHDENISFENCVQRIGHDLAHKIRDMSMMLYTKAAQYALNHGIIIADTKFEFGLDAHGHIVLMDEVLTPDSSRFWPLNDYNVGMSPPSYDKQFVRDWLSTQTWDKTAPAPDLPDNVVLKTSECYQKALLELTGQSIVKIYG